MSAKLKLTGFQRMCLEHALGVDYSYEDYQDRGSLTVEQCWDAHNWIHDKLMIPWERGRAEGDWKRITITIPADMIYAVWYVLDNAVDASTILADGYMYGGDHDLPEGLADAIIGRTRYLIEGKIKALRAVK